MRPARHDDSVTPEDACVGGKARNAIHVDEDPLRLAPETELDPGTPRGLGHRRRGAHRVEDVPALDDVPAGEVGREPVVLVEVDFLAADGLGIGPRVWELVLVDCEDELGARPEVERYRPLLLQLRVDRSGFLQVLVDPRRGLPEEETSVSPGRARTDPSTLDENDSVAALGGVSCDGEAGEAPADDDRFPGQLGV